MPNTKDNLPVSLSVPEEVASAEAVAKPVETDQDGYELAVSDNSIAPNEERSNIEKLKIPDKVWTAFFENMLKVTNEIQAKSKQMVPNVIRSKREDESVQPLELVNYSPEKQVVADPEESEKDIFGDYEAPIPGRPRIEVVKSPDEPFTFVAEWTWDLIVDSCALCCNDINYLCVECQAGECIKSESDVNVMCVCNVSQGICKHVFHSHCILRWLIRRPVCPLCGDFWMTIQCCS